MSLSAQVHETGLNAQTSEVQLSDGSVIKWFSAKRVVLGLRLGELQRT